MIPCVRRTVMINQLAAPFPPYQIILVVEISRRLPATYTATEREQILLVLAVETSCPKVSTVMLVLGATDEMMSCPRVLVLVLKVKMSCSKVSTAMLVLGATVEMMSCPKVLLVLEVETSCPKVSTGMLVLGAAAEMMSCPKVSTLLQKAAVTIRAPVLNILLQAVEGQNAVIHCRKTSIRFVLVDAVHQVTLLLMLPEATNQHLEVNTAKLVGIDGANKLGRAAPPHQKRTSISKFVACGHETASGIVERGGGFELLFGEDETPKELGLCH
jgi:hypothetical protein